ncbi:MAG: oxidoreductase [Pelagibacteraceae bacterium]|nr:oxidoreductase [Pelagibacteraceae bacterium]|tara:strand:- start:5149 stop:5919 length:771 start_codon:yes stop_codon:yes gene_type:complete
MIINFEEFKNKKVIVTGSSTGIGFHTALEFLTLGAQVIFHGNNSTDGLEEKILSKTNNKNFKVIKSNFNDLKNVNNFMNDAIKYLDGLDILVNNAGTMIGRYNLEKISESEFLEIFDLNAKSAYFATKKASDVFKKNNSGCIVNVSTISARTGGSAGSSVYAASKAFVSGITRSLVSELSPFNIRINAISPGTINTKFHEQYSSKEKLEATRLKIPMKRIGSPQDCVGPIVFLCSNTMSGYLTGQIIEINGGQFIS